MIDTQALKNRILNLAMRGQLTEQMPEDGTAEDLYTQIIKKKADLIKVGKMKKEKPLGDVEDEDIPFAIPENWKWVRLKDICTKIVDGDHNPPAGVSEKTEYLMLSAQNINNDGIVNIENARYLSREVFIEENKRTRLEIGDILLTIVATLGRSCVYREKYNVCFQRSVCVISSLINPDFLKRYLDCEYIQKLMVDNATGAAQPGFYLNKVERICVPLPPISEQERIVERIEAVFEVLDKIDVLQNQYASNQETLKSKLIDAAIQGKLTEQLPGDGTAEELFKKIQEEKAILIKEGKIKKEKTLPAISDTDVPFEIPENWKWVRLCDISYRVWAGGDKPDDFSKEIDEIRKIPVVANGVSNEGILGYTSKVTASKNTITVAGRGTIGFTVLRRYDYCPIVRLIVIEQSQYIEPRYLQIFLQSMPETSVGSSIPQLTVPMIKPKLVPLPPLEEQVRISDRVYKLLEVISE